MTVFIDYKNNFKKKITRKLKIVYNISLFLPMNKNAYREREFFCIYEKDLRNEINQK